MDPAMAQPKSIHLLLACLLLAAGCAASSPQVDVPLASAAREEFDPQTLNDDDFLIQPPPRSAVRPGADASPAPGLSGPSKEIDGYRVQVAAVLDRTRAEALRAQAEGKLQVLAYIHYDEDTRLYKIQVGNCETSEDAERLREKVKANAYREAFILRTTIEVTAAPFRPTVVVGFRAQIYSASSRDAAEEAQAKARELLGRKDVYVEFEPPFFKVRIGDFRARDEAERLIVDLKRHGYITPFPVQTQISVSPE